MSDGVFIALIGVFGGIFTLFIKHWIGKLSKRVNGRMDELLELMRKSGNAEGRAELKQEQKDEKA